MGGPGTNSLACTASWAGVWGRARASPARRLGLAANPGWGAQRPTANGPWPVTGGRWLVGTDAIRRHGQMWADAGHGQEGAALRAGPGWRSGWRLESADYPPSSPHFGAPPPLSLALSPSSPTRTPPQAGVISNRSNRWMVVRFTPSFQQPPTHCSPHSALRRTPPHCSPRSGLVAEHSTRGWPLSRGGVLARRECVP